MIFIMLPSMSTDQVPLKDQQATVFGSKVSATNEQFLGTVFNAMIPEMDKMKEWMPTQKDAEELSKFTSLLNDPMFAQMAGPSNLPQLQNLQNVFAESLEKANAAKPVNLLPALEESNDATD